MRSRQWAVVIAVAIVAGAGVGFAAGRLTAPSPSPPPDPDHAAEIDVTILCETSTPCNVTFLVDRAAKWTLIGGCPSAPCSLEPIPTAPPVDGGGMRGLPRRGRLSNHRQHDDHPMRRRGDERHAIRGRYRLRTAIPGHLNHAVCGRHELDPCHRSRIPRSHHLRCPPYDR